SRSAQARLSNVFNGAGYVATTRWSPLVFDSLGAGDGPLRFRRGCLGSGDPEGLLGGFEVGLDLLPGVGDRLRLRLQRGGVAGPAGRRHPGDSALLGGLRLRVRVARLPQLLLDVGEDGVSVRDGLGGDAVDPALEAVLDVLQDVGGLDPYLGDRRVLR